MDLFSTLKRNKTHSLDFTDPKLRQLELEREKTDKLDKTQLSNIDDHLQDKQVQPQIQLDKTQVQNNFNMSQAQFVEMLNSHKTLCDVVLTQTQTINNILKFTTLNNSNNSNKLIEAIPVQNSNNNVLAIMSEQQQQQQQQQQPIKANTNIYSETRNINSNCNITDNK